MHARAGTPDGVMNHTVSGQSWQDLWFNGTLVGETGINAALCGSFGTPVALVTGDAAACREATELLGDGVTTVSVKQGIGASAARMIPPVRVRELIEAGAKAALADLSKVSPYDPGRPCEIRVLFKTTTDPAKLEQMPGVELVDPRTVVSRADDWWAAWRQFFFS
jgi:D-amino peptidase